MAKRDFVIRARRPRRRLLLVMFGLALIAVVLYVAYLRGHHVAMGLNTALRAKHEALLAEHRTSLGTITGLRASINGVERDALVDKAALERLRAQLKRRQRLTLDLREEVELYKGILQPAKSVDNPQVVSFRLLDETPRSLSDGVVHRFRVILASAQYVQSTVSGQVGITVTGDFNGELRSYAFSKVSATESSELRFRFKQYQRLEGQVKLPAELIPRRVVVQVTTDSLRVIERTFDWPEPLD